MELGLTVDEVLRTTRSVRKRIDFDRPVEREVLLECLEAAVQAPTGSNGQHWRWLFVTDPDTRMALGDIYRKGWERYRTMPGNVETTYRGDDPDRIAQQRRVQSSSEFMAENIHRMPAMLIPCLPWRVDGAPPFRMASSAGSIIPGAWSFMLAARDRGLGTTWTTLHLMFEEEAADVLGIPYEHVTQWALITIGYTKGTDFKPAKRPPIETVTRWETWDRQVIDG